MLDKVCLSFITPVSRHSYIIRLTSNVAIADLEPPKHIIICSERVRSVLRGTKLQNGSTNITGGNQEVTGVVDVTLPPASDGQSAEVGKAVRFRYLLYTGHGLFLLE